MLLVLALFDADVVRRPRHVRPRVEVAYVEAR
jgi:hypothetical protein